MKTEKLKKLVALGCSFILSFGVVAFQSPQKALAAAFNCTIGTGTDLGKIEAGGSGCVLSTSAGFEQGGTNAQAAASSFLGTPGASNYIISSALVLNDELSIPNGVTVFVNAAVTGTGKITGTGTTAGTGQGAGKLVILPSGSIVDTIKISGVTGNFSANSTDTACVPGTTAAESKGVPANSVSCDVTINAEVLETITLTVNAAAVTIPSPNLGSNNNVSVSPTALEAKVDTNSADGAALMIKGVGTGTCGANAAEDATSLCYGTNRTAAMTNSVGGTAPTPPTPEFFTAGSTASSWGYHVAFLANTAASTPANPTPPTLTTPYPTFSSTDYSQPWFAGVTADDRLLSGTGTDKVWPGPTDSNAAGAKRAFFFFGQQIAATTASGIYSGKIKLTAVPQA